LGLHFVELSEFHLGFWNFPETAWRSRATCQVTQATNTVFWDSSMNRLAAENDPPGDANWVAQFFVVLDIFGLPVRSQ